MLMTTRSWSVSFKAVPNHANLFKMCYHAGIDKQLRLPNLCDELAQIRTKKKEFLETMDRIIPWGEWIWTIVKKVDK